MGANGSRGMLTTAASSAPGAGAAWSPLCARLNSFRRCSRTAASTGSISNNGVASDPIDVPHLFVLINHDDRGWDGIQDLVRRVKQGLHLLRFNGHLIGQ